MAQMDILYKETILDELSCVQWGVQIDYQSSHIPCAYRRCHRDSVVGQVLVVCVECVRLARSPQPLSRALVRLEGAVMRLG